MENERTAMESQAEWQKRLHAAFEGMDNAVIVKTQTSKTGRIVVIALMVLASALLAGVLFLMRNLTLSLRLFGIAMAGLVYVFFMARFTLALIVDVRAARFAEQITYLRDNGERFYFGKGRYTQKFEYAGGFVALWGKDNYDKFSDKGKYSPLASRYDKNLQRRSSNYTVLSEEFLLGQLASGLLTVGEFAVTSQRADGDWTVEFTPDGRLKSVVFEGAADRLFDSCSPLHILNAKLAGKYRFTYTFTQVNLPPFDLTIPAPAAAAVKDFLLPQPQSDRVHLQ